MIAEDAGSALVLESDADWDIRIKDILSALPRAITEVTNFASWPAAFSHPHAPVSDINPYSLNWDILWLGHSGITTENRPTPHLYSWNDTTVPPKDKQWLHFPVPHQELYLPGTRSLHQFAWISGAIGYAVSREGAAKLVKRFETVEDNLDTLLGRLCTESNDFICLGIWPQIFTVVDSKSNIRHAGNGDLVSLYHGVDEKAPPAGGGIQFSAQANAPRVLKGKGREDWIAEWNTMWAPIEHPEGSVDDGKWKTIPLNRTAAFGNRLIGAV